MVIRVPGGATLILAGLVTISCGGVVDPSKNTVEPFMGTVSPGGPPSVSHVTVNNGGEYSIKITALSPTPTAILGIGWYQGANCEIRGPENIAGLNQLALSGPVYQKGPYCVLVYDLGYLTVAQNFTVTVSHP
jgi:hypothetical protein